MRLKWITIAVFLLLSVGSRVGAQTGENMVYNPSFEAHSRCPDRVNAMGIMTEVEAWWQPTAGSSDYFHTCGGRETGVPRNKMGFQDPRTGEAYCGIYCSQEHYREYLQTELKQPLERGKRYRVGFWVSLSEKSPHAVASLGALFTVERPTDSTYEILQHRDVSVLDDGTMQSIATPFSPQCVNETVVSETKGWVEIAGEFVADGDERYLTIGNFLPFNRSSVVATGAPNAVLQGAYYYIDDVSVVCLDCRDTIESGDDRVAVGDTITLKGVYFDTDKSDILPHSYRELNRLVSLLEKYPKMKVELRGHTDNTGTIGHNQRLSEARARAVAEYLMAHGIAAQRLSYVGFGQTMPVDDNATEHGRANNRRVECRILAL